MNRSRVTGDLASHGNIFVDIANDRVGIGSTIPGQKLSLPDSAKIALGNSADLTLYHDGTNSYVNNTTGTLFYLANTHYFTNPAVSEIQATFVKDGAVDLYHNGTKKFETTSSGVTVTGTVTSDGVYVGDNEAIGAGGSTDLQLYHDANGSAYGTANSSYIKVQGTHDNILDIFTASATGKINLKSNNLTETMLSASGNGAVELYFNNTKRFETTNTGASVTGNFAVSGQTNLTGDLTLTSTDAGAAAAPTIDLVRNSSSPADNDLLGQLRFSGKDDQGSAETYAYITGKILDASAGGEDGILEFTHRKNSSFVITGRWRSDSLQLLNSTNFSVAGTSEFTGDATFNGGAGAITLGAGDDIRLTNGNWTGDHNAKIQHHNNSLYLQGGSGASNNKSIILRGSTVDRWYVRHDGHFYPNVDSTYDIGSSSVRVRNGYFDTLYGDGSNLTGITQTTINSNVNNYVVTATGTANTLQGEANLTFSSGRLNTGAITLNDNGVSGALLNVRADDQAPWAFVIGNDTYHASSGLYGYQPNNGDFLLRLVGNSEYKSFTFEQYNGSTNRSWATFGNGGNVVLHYQGNERFRTNNDGASITGDLSLSADDPTLTFIDTNNNNFRITANTGNLYIADATANQTRAYMSSGGAWTLQNNVTITKTGDPILTVTGSGHAQLTLTSTSGTDHCGVNFGDSSDHNAGMIQYTNNGDYMVFHTAGLERIRIKGDGKTQFSNATDNIIHTSSNSSRLRLFGGGIESVSYGGTLTLHGVSHSAGNYTDLSAATGGHIQFRVGTSEKLRITSGGNVGINESSNINGRLHVQHDALAENILYATRYNDQGNDKPILAITEAQMSAMANSGLVIGPHNRDIHIGPVFGSSANVDTNQVRGLRIDHAGRVGINTATNVSHEYLTVKPIGDNVLDIAYRLNSSTDIRHKHYSDDGEYRGGFNYTRYSNSTRYPNLHHDHYWTTNPSGTSTQVSMRLTREGYLLQQYVPAFGVAQTTNPNQIASGVYVFNEVYFNNGNHYSSSNGRFTAPKAGAYCFSFSLQLYGGNAAHCRFQINGSDVFQNGTSGPVYEDGPDSHETVSHTMVLNLAQGDYVHVARSSTTRGMQSSFCGHLIG